MKCPICNWMGSAFINCRGRLNARCPKCGSLERHRHQYLILNSSELGAALKNGRVLHIGPRKYEQLMLSEAQYYFSCDLNPQKGQICCCLETLPFKTSIFDLLWVSHVLEHIPNLLKALQECYRVLKPFGLAMFDVPLYDSLTKQLEQPDYQGHYWHPGLDWFDRYLAVGFKVTLYDPMQYPMSFGLLHSNTIAVCQKPLCSSKSR